MFTARQFDTLADCASRETDAIDGICNDIARIGREMDARRKINHIAARCPKAEAIMKANRPDRQMGGIPGMMQVAMRAQSPEHYKYLAAERIVYLRRNRITLKQAGRNWRRADAVLLEQAAELRREAARRMSPERRAAR